MKAIYATLPLCLLAIGCSVSRPASTTEQTVQGKLNPGPVIGGPVQALPMAVVYRTSGGCDDRVPITLTDDGKMLLSYPAPTDLNADQMPVNLGDGWWLDRRGISSTSVLTDYTYEEYEALSSAPSPQMLMNHIDPECKITDMWRLPITVQEAASDPAVARAYTESGFADCIKLK